MAVIAVPAGARTQRSKLALSGARVRPIDHSQLSVNGAATAPTANWSLIADIPVGVAQTGGGAFSGRNMYVPGGFKADQTLHDKMQTYSSSANAWVVDAEPIIDAPEGWADAAICTNPQTRQIHYVNGIDSQFLYASHRVYNPAAPPGTRWSFLALPQLTDPGATTYFSQSSGCAWLGGMMYLFGGYGVVDQSPYDDPGAVLRTTWVYDPVTDTWADTGRLMKSARIWFGYTNIASQAFAIGGAANVVDFTSLASTERFAPATGWANMPALPEGRLAPGAGVFGTNVTVFGGGTGDAFNGYALHNTTLGCPSGCITWADLDRQLNTHRWFTAWASGGRRLWDVSGGGVGDPALVSGERTP
jgi:hypothetical protein